MKVYRKGLVILLYKAHTNGLKYTERKASAKTIFDTSWTIYRYTKKFKIPSFSEESIAHFLAQDGDPGKSQRHLVALDADFHGVCRSAFFPDVRELPHLFIQSTDTLLGGPLKLQAGQKLKSHHWNQWPSSAWSFVYVKSAVRERLAQEWPDMLWCLPEQQARAHRMLGTQDTLRAE